MQVWMMPVGFLIGGLLFGFILEKVVLARLRKLSSTTSWEADNILIESLGRFVVLWFFLLGTYGFVMSAPIRAQSMEFAEKALIVLFILSITFFAARVAGRFIDYYGRTKETSFRSATILTNFTRVAIFIVGLLIIFYSLGINVTPALTAVGLGGLAVALALQETLANFFSGLQIMASRQISAGDYVRLSSGEEGYVTDINWRSTTLRTLPNSIVVIPNSKFASGIFTNFYQPDREIAVLVQVGVSYSSDLSVVERVTREVGRDVMKEVAGGVPEFEPFIRYHTFGDSGIQFTVILRGKEFVDQHLLKHEFIKRLHERYRKEQIEIPFPIRTVHIRRSNDDASG